MQAAIRVGSRPRARYYLFAHRRAQQQRYLIIRTELRQSGNGSRRHATCTHDTGVVAPNIEQPTKRIHELDGDAIEVPEQFVEGGRIVEAEERWSQDERSPCAHQRRRSSSLLQLRRLQQRGRISQPLSRRLHDLRTQRPNQRARYVSEFIEHISVGGLLDPLARLPIDEL